MADFNRRTTKPLGFDIDHFKKYVNKHRNDNDSLENFIHLSPEQKEMFLNIPLECSIKYHIPSTISLEEIAHYFSRASNLDYKDEFEEKAKYIIDKQEKIPFPKGIHFRNFLPIVSYTESYKPIFIQQKFVGAVYELVLENQFPQVVRTEKMFACNERINNFINYIQQEVNKPRTEEDIPIGDLFGPAYNESTIIRTVPEIMVLNSFILDNFIANNFKEALKLYQNHTSSEVSAAKNEVRQEN